MRVTIIWVVALLLLKAFMMSVRNLGFKLVCCLIDPRAKCNEETTWNMSRVLNINIIYVIGRIKGNLEPDGICIGRQKSCSWHRRACCTPVCSGAYLSVSKWKHPQLAFGLDVVTGSFKGGAGGNSKKLLSRSEKRRLSLKGLKLKRPRWQYLARLSNLERR